MFNEDGTANTDTLYFKVLRRLNELKLKGVSFSELRGNVELIESKLTKKEVRYLNFMIYQWEEYYYLTGKLSSK